MRVHAWVFSRSFACLVIHSRHHNKRPSKQTALIRVCEYILTQIYQCKDPYIQANAHTDIHARPRTHIHPCTYLVNSGGRRGFWNARSQGSLTRWGLPYAYTYTCAACVWVRVGAYARVCVHIRVCMCMSVQASKLVRACACMRVRIQPELQHTGTRHTA